MGHVDNADDRTRSVERLAATTTDFVIQEVFVNGPGVLTWDDTHTPTTPPMPIPTWCHVEDGQFTRIRGAFDPRPMLS